MAAKLTQTEAKAQAQIWAKLFADVPYPTVSALVGDADLGQQGFSHFGGFGAALPQYTARCLG